MKRALLLLAAFTCSLAAHAADPLRVFIRGGESNRGQQAHAHPRFLAEWKKLLAERGMEVDAATDWPTAEQFKKADVIVAYAQDGGNATPEQQKLIGEFTKRGGGLVIIHTAAVSNDPPWWKSVIGGAWVPGKTKWKEGPMDLYFTESQRIEDQHPITQGASNFHLDDEIYYDMDVAPEVRVLATSYTPNVPAGKKVAEGGKPNIYDIQPQMWAYEKDGYRAFVSIPGHLFSTFELPNFRAILLRGISWAGKRTNLDEYCKKEELEALRYPPGGPQRPADTLKALEVHPDFTLQLVAAEPLINKPMNFDWDAKGRLWVAETPEYPNGRRGMRPDYRGKEWKDHGGIDPDPGQQERKAQDKISILTDTDGDGVMDKKEVFYEGLELVTGLVFYKDGVIVTQAPDILWLRDTNSDGKADKVEKLYTGLGIGDTHAVINNPRWGWDGWVYATHGYSASNKVQNSKGETQGNIGSGVVRFLPDGSKMEQYSSKGGNTWGLTITGDNRVMWTQPTSGTILEHTVLPEYALARGALPKQPGYKVVIGSPKSFPAMEWEQLAYVQIDLVGSFTATAGCVIYDGGAWPEEYNGDYFTTEPTINIVHHERLKPEGASYVGSKLPGRENTEFIRSKDMWWRPIEVRVGPDGAVYIADFYNQAVIHNDTRGPDHNRVNAAVRPDRDHYFGRIWRLNHKQAKKLPGHPDLTSKQPGELVKALTHPNAHVRATAARLLAEKPAGVDANAIRGLVSAKDADSGSKVAALWALAHTGPLDQATFAAATASADPDVRRNAALLAEAGVSIEGQPAAATAPQLEALIRDQDAHVRVAALRALATGKIGDAAVNAIVTAWPTYSDDFQRSAAIGAVAQNLAAAIVAVLEMAGTPDSAATGGKSLMPLVAAVSEKITKGEDAAKVVIAIAGKPSAPEALKRSILETLARSVTDAPAMSPELSSALGKMLASDVSGSVLPLAAKWDKGGALKGEITKLTTSLLAQVENASASGTERLAAAQSLLGLRGVEPKALPAVLSAATASTSPDLQRQMITALAETGDPTVGPALASNFDKLAPDAQGAAFEVLLQRADWAQALLAAVKAKQADVSKLGPANLARLRTHPDQAVAKTANAMLDDIFGPAMKAKNEALAKLTPIVEQPGNVANGKMFFTATCATCHKMGDVGADIGPPLTGMGAHGPAELLTAIVDPNREVDPSFVAWNIETKDGKFHSGVIARENPTNIVVKSLAGQEEIKTADIKTRVNTGRSLMPEGFEGLGGETLRDILAYMQAESGGGKFRTLDLSSAATANTARGLYVAEKQTTDTLKFVKTGTVTVEGIPFNIVAPDRARTNVIVLKGGPPKTFSKSLPQRVDVPVGGFKANRLHFLGGVAGWGHPYGPDKEVLMKVTAHTVHGQRETFMLKNGVEFADYIREVEVPGSKLTKGIVKENQLRWFTLNLSRPVEIDRLTLESVDSESAPTTVAITAELAEGAAAHAKPAAQPADPAPSAAAKKEDAAFTPQFNDPVPQPPATRPANGPRVLLVGGGSSHDFVKFFGAADKATLAPAVGWVDFTQNANAVAPILKDIDVLVWSANQPISGETRKALMDFAASGKGIIALHPGTWYAWNTFPAWNREIVGGGTRGHDNLGPYPVTVTKADHPITKGVPATFEITDELYNFIADPQGTPIEVLATATSPKTEKSFPQVFVVKHPKARVVGITLGHDARAHDLPAYQTLLKNAVLWAGEK